MNEYQPSPREWVAEQVERYEGSGGTEGLTLRDTGLPVVIVTNKGRNTGAIRKTPLMRAVDGNRYILVASQGGAPRHPHWYHNFKADPHVEIRDKTEVYSLPQATARRIRTRTKGKANTRILLGDVIIIPTSFLLTRASEFLRTNSFVDQAPDIYKSSGDVTRSVLKWITPLYKPNERSWALAKNQSRLRKSNDRILGEWAQPQNQVGWTPSLGQLWG